MPSTLPPNASAHRENGADAAAPESLAEPAFDRALRLAVRLLQAPFALAVRLDGSAPGLWASHGPDAARILAESGFLAATVLASAPLALPDAAADARLRDSPLVQGPPGLRSYLGVPLLNPGGERLGTLCVLDTVPRAFSGEDLAGLAELASGAVEAMNLRRAKERALAELEQRKRADFSIRASRDELEVRVQQRSDALAEAESRYRSIFENAVEGIYQISPGGCFLSVNPAFARLLGYPSPGSLLSTVTDPTTLYVRPSDRAEFEQLLNRDGTVANRVIEAYRSDGSTIWLSENAHAVRDEAGRVVRYEGTVNDITARRAAEDALHRAQEELEDRVHERTAELALLNGDLLAQVAQRQHAEEMARRSESKFRTLLENAQDLIAILTPEGVLLYASPSMEHILGYHPDEVIGKNIFGYLHPDDGEAAAQRFQRTANGEGSYLRSEARLKHRDGTWRILESISSPMPPDFPVVSLVINSRDVTERRRSEREMEARARQQAAAAELSRYALREEVDLQDFFDYTSRLVNRVLGTDRVGISELLPGSDRLRIRAGHGFPEGVVGCLEIENWHAQAAVQGAGGDRPVLVPDLREMLDYDATPAFPKAAIGAISAAIHDGTRPYGTLAALSTVPREFTLDEQVFLQTVADLLSTVIVSHRHQAESREVEARYQRIAANTPGMVYQLVLHADGRFSLPFVSQGCRQIFEMQPTQVQTAINLFHGTVHPDDVGSLRQAIFASAEGLSPCNWEGRLRLPSGTGRSIVVRMQPERQANGDTIWDGVVLDVSELKRTEEALRAAKEEAERANNAKSEFLSRMSHELRTPLNAILGFGQLLQLETLTPPQATSVEQIVTGGRQLLDLINEILDIARIEAGNAELNLEPVDLREAVAATLLFVRPMAEQHGVTLRQRAPAGPGVLTLADPRRLNQVLLNLLANAIKYNRPGGRVGVSLRGRAGDRVRITVADTGPGLTAEEQAQLFAPFQRLKAPERGITGTGIGLTIAKSLVEAMGGTVGVRSRPGLGSCFHFDLPLLPADVEKAVDLEAVQLFAPSGPEEAVPVATKTLLHIDDQPANLSLIERLLTLRDNVRLLAAADARRGLALAREERPDLILLDLHLPDLGGDEVVRRLRTEPRTRDIPILVLSADATPCQIARLRELGVRDYLTKPFKIDVLLRALDSALSPADAKEV